MAKVMTAKVKLQCPGGQATPAPPVGPALGQHGVNIGQFVMQFNERTKEMKGTTIPVEITIYSDRSFEFITKSPPAAVLLKQTAGIASGSAEPHKTKVGTVTADQVRRSPRPSSTTSTPATSTTPAGSSPARPGAWGSRSRAERRSDRPRIDRHRDRRTIQSRAVGLTGRRSPVATRDRRRDRPPATARRIAGSTDGGSPPRKERRTWPIIRSAIAPCARRSSRRPGPAGRGGQAAEDVRHDEVQPDGRGLDQPGDRPPAERPERPRLGGPAARHRQERPGGGLRPGRERREGARPPAPTSSAATTWRSRSRAGSWTSTSPWPRPT